MRRNAPHVSFHADLNSLDLLSSFF
jgi:hypothetical protein